MNAPRVIPIDLDAIGAELRTPSGSPRHHTPDFETRLPQTQRREEPFLPAPRAGAHDLGAMTAEAVLKQHEAAAQAVVDMGKQVTERIATLEAALRECHQDMELIAKAANTIREKGEKVAQQVAEAGQLSVDIRAVCSEFVKKVGAGT